MVENGEPQVTLAEEDHQGLDGGYEDVDAVVKLLVIYGPKVRDLEACPPRSHVSTLCACNPVEKYAHPHAHTCTRTHTHSGLQRWRTEAEGENASRRRRDYLATVVSRGHMSSLFAAIASIS